MPLDGKNYTDDLTDTEIAARADLMFWLDFFPARVPALLEAVQEGRLDGGYYLGECRCVMGHLWSSEPVWDWQKAWDYGAIAPIRNAIEMFVTSVAEGDTPANSHELALIQEWIMQWQAA